MIKVCRGSIPLAFFVLHPAATRNRSLKAAKLAITLHSRLFVYIRMSAHSRYVTESRKTVPNHTFLFHYIYYRNMNGIIFSTLFHIITWNLMFKLSKLCNKYSRNTYT